MTAPTDHWVGASARVIEGTLAGLPVKVATRPGLPGGEGISPLIRLLAERARIESGQRVLVSPCGHGALGVWAAARAGAPNVVLRDAHAAALESARETCALNGASSIQVQAGTPLAGEEPFDVIFMTLPKGRELARLYLVNGYLCLKPGGQLYLAGENRGGIKSVIRDAEELFGAIRILGYKGGGRAAVCVRRADGGAGQLPEAFRAPGLLEGSFHSFPLTLEMRRYTICSRPGVFSWEHLDDGTRLFLEALDVKPGDDVADVGCGYGVIGLYAAYAGATSVTLIDVDWLACQCARETLRRNGVDRASVIHGDGLAAVGDRRFTLVVSNPAFHSGLAVSTLMLSRLVEEAHAALEPGGRLAIVANRFLPYEHAMGQVFGQVAALAETPRYRVLAAYKSARKPRAPRHSPTR